MFKLLWDNIAVRKLPTPEKIGSIFVPETVRPDSAMRCEVIAVGEGKRTRKGAVIPNEVSVGDIVYLPKFAGNPITIDGAPFYMCKVSDVLGIEDSMV